jgi:hypothetical protein
MATANLLSSDLALEDRIEPIEDPSDLSLHMPIKHLRK